MVGAKMLSRIDSAQSCFLGCVRKAVEVAIHSLQRLGGDIKSEPISEVGLQHFGASKTDRTVSARVGRVRSSFGWQRQPIRIGLRSGIAVFARQSNRSHRAPEYVCVLRFEEADRRVGKTDVQECKKSRALCQAKVVPYNRRLRDLIPEVLNVAGPELPNQSLLRGTSCAVNDPQTLDFVKGSGIRVAG